MFRLKKKHWFAECKFDPLPAKCKDPEIGGLPLGRLLDFYDHEVFDHGYTLTGGDLAPVLDETSMSECHALCDANPECGCASWHSTKYVAGYYASGYCFLKSVAVCTAAATAACPTPSYTTSNLLYKCALSSHARVH